jgi:glucose-6-phosphate dehydrogenase assembly protein OpcA
LPVAHRTHRFARWRHAVGQHADRPDRRQPGAPRGGQP